MTITILAIDDSEDEQRLYQRALRNIDCRLVMASSAKAGFICMADLKPDVILLDYNLPDLDGLSIMKVLAGFSDNPVPVIMLTGEGSESVAVEVMKSGADDYLVKDTAGQYLRLLPGIIVRAVASHAQREQNQRLVQETARLLRRNQLLMQNSVDGIHVMDIEGNLVEANDAFCRMLGYTQEEVASLNVADWDAQWTAGELQARFKNFIGKSGVFETLHRRKDGTLVHVEISTSHVEMEGQHLFFALSRDITERKRAEDALLLNKTIIETAYDGFWMFGTDGYLCEVNQAYANMVGYTREELIGMHISRLSVPSNTPELVKVRIENAISRGLNYFETQHRHKDGHAVDFEASIAYIPEVHCLFSFIRDISERKKTEAALRLHKLMLDTSIDGFWVCNMEGYLLEANEAYANISGYTVDELVSMHISQLEAVEQNPEDVHAHIAKVIAQGYDRFETRHRHKDGHEIDIEVAVTYMAEPQRTVVFCRDITERKKAEKKILLESEAGHKRAEVLAQQFGSLLQGSFNEIYLFDAYSLHFLLTSEGAEKNLGYSSDELNQLTPLDIKPLFTQESFEQLIAPLRSGKQPSLFFETVHRRKDGTTYPVEVRLQLMEGEYPVFLAIIQDVTERKQAERWMYESMEKIEDLYNNAPCGYHSLDKDGIILMINDTELTWLGYTRDEVVGKIRLVDLLTPAGRQTFNETFQQFMQQGVVQDIELEFIRKDGAVLVGLVSATAIYDSSDNFVMSRSTVADITERKRAEEMVHEQKVELEMQNDELQRTQVYLDVARVRYFDLYDLAPVGYCTLSETGLIMESNLAVATMLGMARRVLTKRKLSQFIIKEDQDIFYLFYKQFAQSSEPQTCELRMMKDDGTQFWAHLKGVAAQDEGGVPTFRIVMSDITGRKKAEHKLRELTMHLQSVREEEKAGIAREIHDDLGGTLTAMKMETHQLKAALPPGENAKPLLEHVESISQLVSNAASITRRIISDLRPTILDDLGLLAAIEWQAAQFRKHSGIECWVNCIGDKGNLDKARSIALFRILQEALTNVMRHSGASRVEIEFHHNDEEVVMSVIDNGRGMAEIRSDTSIPYGILGMNERVDQLGGKISLDTPPGGGVNVTVILPLPINKEEKT